MKFKDSVGIDVSKKTIDAAVFSSKETRQFDNDPKGFKDLIKWIKKGASVEPNQIIICFENTGIYSLPLALFLDQQKISFSVVPAMEIKRSMGLVRGKNDIVDAIRIAEYAYLRRELLTPSKMPSKNIQHLQKLLSTREKLVKQKAGYSADYKEYSNVLKAHNCKSVLEVHKKMIHYLNKQILILEKEIKTLIKNDHKINEIYALITSVKGIGLVLASNFIVLTNCFTNFKDSRKFACYAGVAPFHIQSGTSLLSKSKVNHCANKKMKALLNMAAFSAIQCDPELRLYYQNRVEKGKSKMSTLNIIRNKIVHRVFAVVRRGTPYVMLENITT